MWCGFFNDNHRGIGAKVPAEDKDGAIEVQNVFRKWLDESIISANSKLLLDALLLMPFSNATPNYRDTQNR